jgi:hypothetical protein
MFLSWSVADHQLVIMHGESPTEAVAHRNDDARIIRLRLQRVLHDFGETLTITTIDAGSFKVSTPFAFANGEMFPIVLEVRGAAWRITDRGGTIAHLSRHRRELAMQHIDAIRATVRATSFTISDANVVSADLDGMPSPRDIADFIQIAARIGGLESSPWTPTPHPPLI